MKVEMGSSLQVMKDERKSQQTNKQKSEGMEIKQKVT